MNNLHYDFHNTGYKIHLPVVPDVNDPLTRKIADFLDQKFGLNTSTKSQYKTCYYKVGSGGELEGGKGITLYGRTQSMQEMQELAQEIEQKFGKELADNVKKYNITFEDPLKLSNSVQARFAAYHHGYLPKGTKTGIKETLLTYCNGNPSGAIPTRICTTIDGVKRGFCSTKGLSAIDKKFWYGDSTMYAIDNFGELFSGKITNGKVPQFIMDGLPKEYLQHYHLTEKDIIARINKGTQQIVANMLEDVATNPKSAILLGNPPWLTTLDPKVIDEAKELLRRNEPQIVQKLEQMLSQLEKTCPSLSVLKAKQPLKSNLTPHLQKQLDEIRASWQTHQPVNKVKTTSSVGHNFSTWVDDIVAKFNSKGGKIGLCVVGAVALAGVATSIFAQSDNKELLATNKPSKQTNIYGNCFSMPKGNIMV